MNMKTGKRVYDQAPQMIGGLLFLVPCVFGIATLGSLYWNTWLFGAVVGIVAVFLACLWWMMPRNGLTEGVTMLVGMIVCVSPWLLNENWSAGEVVAVCLLGALLLLSAGSENWSRQHWFGPEATRNVSESATPYRQRLGNSGKNA